MTDSLPRPDPFWCGSGDAQCFAVLHRPARPATRGVVLCNGLGFDGLLAHRTLRILATRLAAAGVAALRFDLPGTGDSPGGDWEPNRLDTWCDGLASAVGALRACTGVDDVHLLGFRMGAAVAMLYAERSGGVSGLSLWAPCSKGRTFVRELHALARFRGATQPPQPLASAFPEDSLEVVGFEFTSATLRDLSGVDLTLHGAPRPAPHVLVLDRDDATGSDALVAALRASGAEVDHREFAGYLEFMTDDETVAVLPDAALNELVDWHVRAAPVVLPACTERVAMADVLHLPAGGAGRIAKVAECGAVVERPTWIADQLLAVVTRPSRSNVIARTAIVLANTGSVNRAGPGRLHVGLARYWASLGYTVVRVDLGGTGDSAASDPATENSPYAPDRIAELEATIDAVGALPGIDEVVAFGVCSGAFNSLHGALQGADVGSIVLVNPLIFSLAGDEELATSRDRAVLSANRLSVGLSRRSWTDVRTRHGGLLGAARRARELMSEGAVRGYAHLLAARVRGLGRRVGLGSAAGPTVVADLARLHHEGVNVVLAFADDEPGERYLRSIGGSAFERLVASRSVRLIRVPGGDHVFSPSGARRQLVSDLTQWLLRQHPVGIAPEDLPPLDAPAVVADDAGSRTARVGRAATRTGVVTALSRLVGLTRILVISAVLGTTYLGNTFQSSNSVSNVLFELLAAGGLSAAIVPALVRAASDRDDTERLANGVLGVATIALGLLAVIGVVAAPLIGRILATGAPAAVASDQRALATFLVRWFVPQVLLYGLGTVATAVLHSRRKFAIAAAAPIANTVVMVGCFVAFRIHAGRNPGLALDTTSKLLLAAAGTGGVLAFVAMLTLPVWRDGVRLRPQFRARDPRVRTLLAHSGWGILLNSVGGLLAAAMVIAGNVVEGGIVAFQLAFFLFLAPYAILSRPLEAVSLPEFTDDASADDHRSLGATLHWTIESMCMLIAPAAALMMVFARPGLIGLGFGLDHRGDLLVAAALAGLAVGLVPYCGFLVLARALYALDDSRTPALVSLLCGGVGVVAIVAARLALHERTLIGALGLAHSLAFATGAALLAAVLRRRTGHAVVTRRAVLPIALAAVVGLPIWLLARLADNGARVASLVICVVGVLAYLVVYATALRVTGLRVRPAA